MAASAVSSEEGDEAVVDACVFHDHSSARRYTDYMPDAWRNLVTRPGDPGGPVNFAARPHHYSPIPKPPTMEPAEFLSDLFRSRDRSHVVLTFEETLLATGFHNPRMAAVAAAAANDWTADQWLPVDDRVFGLLLVASSLPDAAADEIRRKGLNPKIVGVQLGANALGHPYGHPVYRPIFRAAAEVGLPVVLHASLDEGFDQGVSPVAGGPATTYAEHRAFASQPLIVQATSLVIQGVFEDFPDLRIVLVGGGAAWLPAFLWRMDWLYHANAREAPYLQCLPSEHFLTHFHVSTYPLEYAARPGAIAAALGSVPELEKVVVFGSGYPNYDSEKSNSILASIPAPWRQSVLRSNAMSAFRWPAASPAASSSSVTGNVSE